MSKHEEKTMNEHTVTGRVVHIDEVEGICKLDNGFAFKPANIRDVVLGETLEFRIRPTMMRMTLPPGQ